MSSSIFKANWIFRLLFPKTTAAILRFLEEDKKDTAEQFRLRFEAELLLREQAVSALQHQLQTSNERAQAWERTAGELIEKLNQQAELNADLIQERLEIEVSMGRHSARVDRQRMQVLTQFTGRGLNIKKGLLGALHDAVSLNIARHIIRKLAKGDYFDAEKPISEAEYQALADQKPLQLPPSTK